MQNMNVATLVVHIRTWYQNHAPILVQSIKQTKCRTSKIWSKLTHEKSVYIYIICVCVIICSRYFNIFYSTKICGLHVDYRCYHTMLNVLHHMTMKQPLPRIASLEADRCGVTSWWNLNSVSHWTVLDSFPIKLNNLETMAVKMHRVASMTTVTEFHAILFIFKDE